MPLPHLPAEVTDGRDGANIGQQDCKGSTKSPGCHLQLVPSSDPMTDLVLKEDKPAGKDNGLEVGQQWEEQSLTETYASPCTPSLLARW